MKSSCKEHAGAHPLFMTQWDGSEWNRTPNGQVSVVKEASPLIKAAAEEYVSDKPTWQLKAANTARITNKLSWL